MFARSRETGIFRDSIIEIDLRSYPNKIDRERYRKDRSKRRDEKDGGFCIDTTIHERSFYRVDNNNNNNNNSFLVKG